jgi:predicted nucleic acid-binding protein
VKYLDTNVFLRYIASPKTVQDQNFSQLATELFAKAERDEVQFTTSDAVIAEVIYVLMSPVAYHFSRADVFDRLIQLLQLPGCRMEHRDDVMRALSRWNGNPKLSFVDALAIATSKALNADLLTFDTALADDAGVSRWDKQPETLNP